MPANNLSTTTHPPDAAEISFRTATLADAADIWQLVSDSGVLDVNSRYCYLLLCSDFADTCVVACRDARIVGFVAAYRPPPRGDTIFVWQIGVAEEARRLGLGKRILHNLISVPGCHGVRYLESTVTPSNTASRRLFQSFAEDLEVPCHMSERFTADMFGGEGHEEEQRFRIGPFAD